MRFESIFSTLALAATVSAAATSCSYQSPGGSTENGVLNKNCCTPLTVIFARGTAESGNVGTYAGPPFFAALRSQLGNNGVTIQGLNYPASYVGLYQDGAEGGPALKSLISQAHTQCPNSKIVVSGYSQGAAVVHNALSSASTTKLVSGAVLFGDPDAKKAVGTLSSSKVTKYCNSGDVVCEDGILVVTAAHLSYAKYASQAAAAARGYAGI